MSLLETLIAPGSFGDLADPAYIEMLNQITHAVVVGAAPMALLIWLISAADQHRFGGVIGWSTFYFLGWELAFQGWSGADSVIDAAFVGFGALLASISVGARIKGQNLALGILGLSALAAIHAISGTV